MFIIIIITIIMIIIMIVITIIINIMIIIIRALNRAPPRKSVSAMMLEGPWLFPHNLCSTGYSYI